MRIPPMFCWCQRGLPWWVCRLLDFSSL